MVDLSTPYLNWLSPGTLPGLACAGSMDKADAKLGQDAQPPGSSVNFGIFPLPCIVNDCVDDTCCKNGRGPTNPQPAPVLWATRHQNGSITVDRAVPMWQRHESGRQPQQEARQPTPAQPSSSAPAIVGVNGKNGANGTNGTPAAGLIDLRPAEAHQSLQTQRQGGAIKSHSKAPKFWPYQRPQSPESTDGRDLTTATWRVAPTKAPELMTANRILDSSMNDSLANQVATTNLESTDGPMDSGPGLLVSLRNGPGNHLQRDSHSSMEGSQLGLSLRPLDPCSQPMAQTVRFGNQKDEAAAQETGLRDSDAEMGGTGAVVQAAEGDSLLTLKLFTEAPSFQDKDAHLSPSLPAPNAAPAPTPVLRLEASHVSSRDVVVVQGEGRRKSYPSVMRRQIYVLPTPEDGIVKWLKYGQKCIRKGESARDRGYFKCGTGADFKCPAHKWEDKMNGGCQVTYVKDHNEQCMHLQLQLRAEAHHIEALAAEAPVRRPKLKPMNRKSQGLPMVEPENSLQVHAK